MKLSALLSFCFITLFISFLPMHTNGQNLVKTYSSQWKIVEDAIKKGLPESAREEVKKIYELAKKEKQEAQLIKSTIYMIDLQSENQENAMILSIEELEKEVEVYGGLPADREAARKEVGKLEVEMDNARRKRDALFEGLVG